MQYVAPALRRWNALSNGVRGSVLAAGVAAIAASVLWGIAAHPAREPLFAAPLHAEQVAEVEERLASWNVPFTPLSDNLVVDARNRNDALLRLSLAGVPHAHIASTGEALANVGMLTPQSVVDAQTRAGLAGDVEAGLRGIEGLDDARVILVPAKTAEFADESAHDASASVRVRMRAGARFSHAAVAGIRAFVAAAVAGLQPARVTIVDDSGAALDGNDAGDDAGALERSLQTALDGAFGEGATIVRVRAEYATSRTSRHDVRRGPIDAPPLGRVSHDESYDAGDKRYRRQDRSEDRGSDTREVVSETAAGGLKRLSTAVFVDELRAADVAKVRALAAAAVGFDARRGDTLAVEAMNFHRAPVPRKDPWWLLYGIFVPLAPALAIAVGIAAVARMAIPPLAAVLQATLQRADAARTSKAVAGFAPSRVRSALAHEPPHAAAAIISALPAATAAAVLELYPPHERDAIVRRMQRPHAPLLAGVEELLNRHV